MDSLQDRLAKQERTEARLKQGLNSKTGDISTKLKIIGGEDQATSQVCRTTKKLNKMRTNVDIEMIKRRTVQGFENFLKKNKDQDASERVREPDIIADPVQIPLD